MEIYGDKLLKKISITWGAEDVIHQAREAGHTLTKIEVSNVLYQLRHNHDATIGVTWDTLDHFIEETVNER